LRFLQVKEGLSIVVDDIKMIKKTGDLTTKVHTISNVYEIPIPYDILISKLQEGEEGITDVLNIIKETGIMTP